jgi:cytidine deaminase
MSKKPLAPKIPAPWRELVAQAKKVQKKAYAPYSRFQVGTALEDDRGRIFIGCNVENASYSLAMCSERVAVSQMVSAGGKKIRRVALITSSEAVCFPCGSCRQVLSEFGTEEVLAINHSGNAFEIIDFKALFPYSFSAKALSTK